MYRNNRPQVLAAAGFLAVVTITFVVLKLIGYINWNWWTVLMPIWFSIVLLLIFFIGHAVFKLIRKE